MKYKTTICLLLFISLSLISFRLGYEICWRKVKHDQLYFQCLGDIHRYTLTTIVNDLSNDAGASSITLTRMKNFLSASNVENTDIRTFVFSMELITNTDIYGMEDFVKTIRELKQELAKQ